MTFMGNTHLLERRPVSWLQEHQSHSILWLALALASAG